MQIKVEKKTPSEILLLIEITPDEYQKFLEKTAKNLSLTNKIHGFRPGNVPYNVAKKVFGEGEILEHALSDIITHTFVEAIYKEKLETIGKPAIVIKKMTPGENLQYEATVTILPALKLPDMNKISFERPTIEITKDEVEKIINDLARSRATEILENVPAAEKSLVRLDFNIFLDNVPQENGAEKDFAVYLGEHHMVPGFEENIIGLKAKDEKKFELTFPDDYFQKNFAGKTCEFKIKVNGVYRLDIPKINDEFAHSLGNFKNLDDLAAKIKENLLLEKQTRAENDLENKMFDELIKLSVFESLPEKLIDEEVGTMIDEIKNDLNKKNLSWEMWLTNLQKQEKDLRNDFRPQAERRIKSSLIIREFSRANGITATGEEINDEIKKIIKEYPDDDDLSKKLQSKAYRENINNYLTSSKTIKWLKEKIFKKKDEL